MHTKENVTTIPRVTIIMPSLNVVKYIDVCMQSVLNQTLTEIEVLAIDAGSTDGTLEILRNYEKQDSRVRVIVSDKRSYGYQVNLGLDNASGAYIGIVETDDKINPDMYEILYDKAVETNADYVKAQSQAFLSFGMEETLSFLMSSPVPQELFHQVINPCEHPEIFIEDSFLWKGIYKAEFLKDIRLNETPGAAFQDVGFVFQTLTRAKRAVYVDSIGYCYRQDNEGSSIFNHNGFRYLVWEYEMNSKYLIGLSEKWISMYYYKMLIQSMTRFQIMAYSGGFWSEVEDDMNQLRERLQAAVRNGILSEKKMDSLQWERLQIWFKGNQQIYDYFQNQIKEKVRNAEEILHLAEKKDVIIFGCGKWGQFLQVLLDRKSESCLKAYVDNNESLWGQELHGIPVLSPREVEELYHESIYFIANKNFMNEIAGQLYGYGIGKDRIYKYTAGVDMRLLTLSV